MKRLPRTKAQEKREQRYRAQLRVCGFRSWKRANQRRSDLVDLSVESGEDSPELVQLQKLCGLYVKWKSNDATGRWLRRIKRLESSFLRKLNGD